MMNLSDNGKLHDQTVTTRQASYSYLAIDSQDRQPGQPQSNFTINQGAVLASGYPTRIVPVQINFPWSIPNVNQVNNRISITDGTNIFTAVIPEDFYTNAEFATALQLALNSLSFTGGGTFTVTRNAKTFYYTVAVSGTQTFAFIKTPGYHKDLLYMAGFSTNKTQALTQVGTYNTLQYTSYIDIRSDQLTRFQKILDAASDQNSQHIVMRIYCDPGYGRARTTEALLNQNEWWCRPSSLFYEPINPKYMRYVPGGEFISNTDFYITDDEGYPLYMPTGSPDWQLNLLISEI